MPREKQSRILSAQAQRRWESLPVADRESILGAVWCASCSRTSRMVVGGGQIVAGDLVLSGTCSRCGADVERLVESE
jgi:hypothetical protein